jgi:DNA-binding phage protein
MGGLQAAAAEDTLTGGGKMATTKSFKELVQQRVARDGEFATALLREGIDTMLTGDIDTGKAILRDYIKATVGFEKLGEATDTPAKSLIRMFGPRGNPQARNLFGVIGYLQKQAGIELHVAPQPR